MPIYEFNCKKCGRDFEEIVGMSDKETPPCPKCGAKETERLMSCFSSQRGGSFAKSSCGPPGGFS